jgi:Family of unknown function (DUF5752)
MSSKNQSKKVLEPVAPERAFYFYAEVDRPLGSRASSLKEFSNEVRSVSVESLEFHNSRGDFEKWVMMLGDPELAKSMARLREQGVKGDKLRSELARLSQGRVSQLQKTGPKK